MSKLNRRHFVAGAALTVVASKFSNFTKAQRADSSRSNPASFGPAKQIDAGLLNVSYVEVGPANGRPVILLHGWPYDIHSYIDVAPLLAANGYRVIVPYLRGYGSTRFLSPDTLRNGQQSALGADVIALMDALKIEQAVIGGILIAFMKPMMIVFDSDSPKPAK